MDYLCLVGLAKTLHILNQQEIFIYHKACNRPSCEREWNAKVLFCFLMADKTKTDKVDGLNQLFRIPKEGNPRTDIVSKISSIEEIGDSVLSEINVDAIIVGIIANDSPFQQHAGK